jgi:hypothetical protein
VRTVGVDVELLLLVELVEVLVWLGADCGRWRWLVMLIFVIKVRVHACFSVLSLRRHAVSNTSLLVDIGDRYKAGAS